MQPFIHHPTFDKESHENYSPLLQSFEGSWSRLLQKVSWKCHFSNPRAYFRYLIPNYFLRSQRSKQLSIFFNHRDPDLFRFDIRVSFQIQLFLYPWVIFEIPEYFWDPGVFFEIQEIFVTSMLHFAFALGSFFSDCLVVLSCVLCQNGCYKVTFRKDIKSTVSYAHQHRNPAEVWQMALED